MSPWMRAVLALLAFCLAAGAAQAAASVPVPRRYGDFAHYTFALDWLPGGCGDQCTRAQPHDVRLGIHGLWASRPQRLIREHVAPPRWWAEGCGLLGGDAHAALPLDAAQRQAIEAWMPHFTLSLLLHEYRKHVQCFGFDAARFFAFEAQLRQRVADGPLGHYLDAHAGQRVSHADLLAAFSSAYGVHVARALQLRCTRPADGQARLSQLWFTVRRQRVGDFPRAGAYMRAPQAQDDCPAHFVIPDWPQAGASR